MKEAASRDSCLLFRSGGCLDKSTDSPVFLSLFNFLDLFQNSTFDEILAQ